MPVTPVRPSSFSCFLARLEPSSGSLVSKGLASSRSSADAIYITGAGAIIILGHAALLEPGIEGEFAADGQV